MVMMDAPPSSAMEVEEQAADDLNSVSFSSSAGTDANYMSSSSSSSASARSNGGGASSDASLAAAVSRARSDAGGALGMGDLRLVQRLGSGDIGSVYLAEVKGCWFAAKVMDRKELEGRSKEGRARTEKAILEALDHPFLPTLYAAFDSDRWSCLLTEFCPGGDLHVLRQLQPCKRFPETAVRYTYIYPFLLSIFFLLPEIYLTLFFGLLNLFCL